MCLPSEAAFALKASYAKGKSHIAIAADMMQMIDVRHVVVRFPFPGQVEADVFPHEAPFYRIPECTDAAYGFAGKYAS